jgi:hypothetical protein
MEQERMELSQRERDRLKVLHEVEEGHLTQVEASARLTLTARQVRRLQRRVEAEGDRGAPADRSTARAQRLEGAVRMRINPNKSRTNGSRGRSICKGFPQEGVARFGTRIERKYGSRLYETVGILTCEKKTLALHGE